MRKGLKIWTDIIGMPQPIEVQNVNDANSTDISANVYKSKNKQIQEDENQYEECLSCQ